MSRLSAGEGSDDSRSETGFGDFAFKTTQRQYAWQNDFALPVGALTRATSGARSASTTDADFAVDVARHRIRCSAIYQLRVDAHALQANLRHDDSSQYGGKTTGALAYGYRFAPAGASPRATAPASRRRRSTTSTFPDFSNPNLVPETSQNVEVGAYWNGNASDAALELRASPIATR